MPGTLAVALGGPLGELARAAADARPGVDGGLELAALLADRVPLPGGGRTLERWQVLATLGGVDLTAARTLEAHLDALAILAEAGLPVADGATYGVYAAEGPGQPLRAAPRDGGWRFDGRKPWCSLAGRVSHALVTAHVEGGRRLFAVHLRQPGVEVEQGAWHARGLTDVVSSAVTFDDVPVEPVGDTQWYLERPGFAHGGIGVAAVWFGGAVALVRSLVAASGRREPDQVAQLLLGEADLTLRQAGALLHQAAAAVDAGQAAGDAGARLTLRVRSAVAEAGERVMTLTGHALGPAPLTGDAEHAARVADLTVYVRQHHAERDLAALGREVLAAGADDEPW
ncbi:acyl-CoA dehydrogenase [Angustibacter aerolatus]